MNVSHKFSEFWPPFSLKQRENKTCAFSEYVYNPYAHSLMKDWADKKNWLEWPTLIDQRRATQLPIMISAFEITGFMHTPNTVTALETAIKNQDFSVLVLLMENWPP